MPVKGLTREEIVSALVSPRASPSDFLASFEELEESRLVPLHHTPKALTNFSNRPIEP
jgi:hypothetical protein